MDGQIHSGDAVLGDAQPLVLAVEAGVQGNGLLQREVVVCTQVCVVDVLDYIPVIAVGECGISGALEHLAPFFRQPHLLGLLVEAVEICLVVALCGVAPQAVEIPLCLQCKAIVLTAGAALNSSTAARAVPAHGGEVP